MYCFEHWNLVINNTTCFMSHGMGKTLSAMQDYTNF